MLRWADVPRLGRLLIPLLLSSSLASCVGTSLPPDPATRLTTAETEMNDCKERFGLGAVRTPDSADLYDPSTSATLTPEAVSQVRIKTLCSAELAELLNARRSARDRRP